MEMILRIIIAMIILYVVGKEIYQTIRSRSANNCHWTIIVLLGLIIWFHQDFLITSLLYDIAIITVFVLTIASYIVSSKSPFARWLRRASIGSQAAILALFGYWNNEARTAPLTTITTPLRGYTVHSVDEIAFSYNDTPFMRHFHLTNYQDKAQLKKLYDVELTIKVISPNVAKIETIDLVTKD